MRSISRIFELRLRDQATTFDIGEQHATDSSEDDRRRIYHREEKEIVTKLTDAMVAIEGESLRPYTGVRLEEIRSGDRA